MIQTIWYLLFTYNELSTPDIHHMSASLSACAPIKFTKTSHMVSAGLNSDQFSATPSGAS